jgi:phosphohistidine phosphatase SixA
MQRRGFLITAVAATVAMTAPVAGQDNAAWTALAQGGHVILARHALAPGVGDPQGFVLDDCATQRNLSEEGRAQARRMGEALKARGIGLTRILSSRWCRALETARLMDVGEVEAFPPLVSFFGDRTDEPEQTAAVRAFLKDGVDGTVLMVTHQVNITALTGVSPASGEMVVAKPGEDGSLQVVGRIRTE